MGCKETKSKATVLPKPLLQQGVGRRGDRNQGGEEVETQESVQNREIERSSTVIFAVVPADEVCSTGNLTILT